jgi:hypothetical protein
VSRYLDTVIGVLVITFLVTLVAFGVMFCIKYPELPISAIVAGIIIWVLFRI